MGDWGEFLGVSAGVSFAGGAQLMADGVGFSVTASDNSVKLTTTDPPLPTNALTLSSNYLTIIIE